MKKSNNHNIFKTLKIKKIISDSILVSIVFFLVHQFYYTEVIRANVEDIAFDAVNKYIVKEKEVRVNAPNVFVLAVDDIYMHKRGLLNEDNITTYGYLFPRDKLADIIKNVDERCKQIGKENLPKALFIDYDMEFTSMPYGKELSKEDQKFLDVLKASRDYTIVLPKSSAYNFVQTYQDPVIQKKIKDKKIIFVSVDFLQSYDGFVRRYSAYKQIKELNNTEVFYPNVDVLLWYMLRDKNIPTSLKDINTTFEQNDLIANRIKIKSYKKTIGDYQYSYWKNIRKLSASSDFSSIVKEDYKDSILMLGGTYAKNSDTHNVLNFFTYEKINGIDLHANILLSLLSFDGQLERLPLIYGIIIVFLTFFLTSFLISKLLILLKLYNTNFEFIVILIVHTITLMMVSAYLLLHHNIWFNWFVPLIIFQIVELVDFIRDYGPKFIFKIWGEKR